MHSPECTLSQLPPLVASVCRCSAPASALALSVCLAHCAKSRSFINGFLAAGAAKTGYCVPAFGPGTVGWTRPSHLLLSIPVHRVLCTSDNSMLPVYPQVDRAVQSRCRCNRSGGITATSPARLAMRRAYEIHVMGEEHGRRGIRFIKAKSVDPSGPHGCLDHLTIPLGFERHRQQVRMPADPPTCRGIGD